MTELDWTILAIIDRDGPMSAYDVRKVFAESLTPGWSSSTGSVYPAIRRLEAAGMVSSNLEGSRKRRSLRVTRSGRSAVRNWLSSTDLETAAPTPDPIRTRMYFLELLSHEQQLQTVETSLHVARAAVAEAERLRDQRRDSCRNPLQRLAAEGVMYQLRARTEWLEWLLDHLTRARRR